MIVVTGASGFIGSGLIGRLNYEREIDVIGVDSFSSQQKYYNLNGLKTKELIDKDKFLPWLDENYKDVSFIFHIGARTDTREQDLTLLAKLNTDYTKSVWDKCTRYAIPLVYASSAATYGKGELGFEDDESTISSLKPLNCYALSKHNFDLWALRQEEKPPFWAGLKFFNVYGPNEYHKGHMASVIFHGYNQIKRDNKISLFKSYNRMFKDGEQMRDFIYVKDIISVCIFLRENVVDSGIYNVGTGNPNTFLDVAKYLFSTVKIEERIDFIDMPVVYRENYQYYTSAQIQKLRNIGYKKDFYSLEHGIGEYITQYLKCSKLINQK